MDKEIDILIKFYESARLELNNRIVLRDRIIMFYLGAIGALFSIVFSNINLEIKNILLIVPFISLGILLLITQHGIVIGALAKYCVTELSSSINRKVSSDDIKHWDQSEILNKKGHIIFLTRYVGHAVIFILPGLSSLVLNVDIVCVFTKISSMIYIYWIDVMLLFLVLLIIFLDYHNRKKEL